MFTIHAKVPLVFLWLCIVCSQLAVDSPALSGSRYEFWHWHVLICRKLQDTCQALSGAECVYIENYHEIKLPLTFHLGHLGHLPPQPAFCRCSWPEQARRLWFSRAANGSFPNNAHRLSLCFAFLGARATCSSGMGRLKYQRNQDLNWFCLHVAIMMHAVQLAIWYLIHRQLCQFALE